MKTMKIAAIATAIAIALIALCGIATATAETYQVEAVVTEIHIAFPGCWEAIATDNCGNRWGWFFDQEDGEYWQIGDLVQLKMLAGEREEDDEVMDVIQLGTLTPVGVAEWLGW